MSPKKHIYKMLILESHLDTFGHVNNASYLQILEEARWDLVTQQGYGLNRILESGQGPVILEAQLRFRKELRLRQQITIMTEFSSFEKRLAKIHQEILNEENFLCCTAEFKFGLFDTKTRKLIAPTPEWLKAIGADLNEPQGI